MLRSQGSCCRASHATFVPAVFSGMLAIERMHALLLQPAGVGAAAGSWDPIELMLERINSLCYVLLRRASSLRHPQQLAFIPILLGMHSARPLGGVTTAASVCLLLCASAGASWSARLRWALEALFLFLFFVVGVPCSWNSFLSLTLWRVCACLLAVAECPFLEESVDFSELAKLCEVVASLPHSSRRTIAQWCVAASAVGEFAAASAAGAVRCSG